MTKTKTLRIQLLAGVVALALVSVMVVRTSSAVFSGTTDTDGTWSAGTVALSDDDGAVNALADLSVDTAGLKPGDSGSDCIRVDYDGSLATTDLSATGVVLYTSVLTDTDGEGATTGVAAEQLSDDVDVTIAVADPTTYVDCATFTGGAQVYTGTLADMGDTYAAGHTAATPWLPTSNTDARIYKVTWTLGNDTANDAQGDSVLATFTWEVQSA